MRKTGKLIAIVCTLFLLSGCVAAWLGLGAGVGIGTYRYIEGNLVRDYPFTYRTAWDVTNQALANLRISVSSSVDEGIEGHIEAVRRDGKKINVKLDDKGQNVTAISVRVGIMGDRRDAEIIHKEIAAVAGIS